MKTQKPILHARDHMPGGADPIPGLQLGGAASLEAAYLDIDELEAWWRLGEDGPFPVDARTTASFMLDSSSHGRHLSALNQNNYGSSTFTDVLVSDPTSDRLPICNVPGALTAGDPVINDGGIRFNWNAFEWTVWDGQLGLLAPSSVGLSEAAYCTGLGSGFTVTCWVKFLPTTWDGIVNNFAPYSADGHDIGFRPLFGDFQHSFGIGSWGSKYGFDPYYGYLKIQTWNGYGASWGWTSTIEFAPDTWYFLSLTLDKVDATSYTRKVWLNCNEVHSVSGDAAAVGVADSGTTLTLGQAWDDDLRMGHGAGCLDEFAIFSKALTNAELFAQMTAKVEHIGDVWTTTIMPGPSGTDGTIASGTTPDGYAILADGSGGTKWGLPKHRVYVNGA